MFEDDLFWFVPDMDRDGDHDLYDYLMHDEYMKETTKDPSSYGLNEDDIYDEYDEFDDERTLDLEYGYVESKEENSCEFDEDDLVDYEYIVTEDNFDNITKEYDFKRQILELTSEIEAILSDEDTLLKNKEYLPKVKDRSNLSVSLNNILERRNIAERIKEAFHKQLPVYDSNDLNRSKFITEGKTLASMYLTVDGIYLYAQALKDNFKLPFEIPDEIDCVITQFESLLLKLYEYNSQFAMEVWEWCIDVFVPYFDYNEYKQDLMTEILMDIDMYPDSFIKDVVLYMEKNPQFIKSLIFNCTDELWNIDLLIMSSLKLNCIEVGKNIIRYAFANKNMQSEDRIEIIDNCINECFMQEDADITKLFFEYIFPIVYFQPDIKFKDRLLDWEASFGEISDFEFEDFKKTHFKIDSSSVELSTDKSDLNLDLNLYRFCQVSVNYPRKPYYHYFMGDFDLKPGDMVTVPFGEDNNETTGVVMTIGECYGCSFPCDISCIKTVMKKHADITKPN